MAVAELDTILELYRPDHDFGSFNYVPFGKIQKAIENIRSGEHDPTPMVIRYSPVGPLNEVALIESSQKRRQPFRPRIVDRSSLSNRFHRLPEIVIKAPQTQEPQQDLLVFVNPQQALSNHSPELGATLFDAALASNPTLPPQNPQSRIICAKLPAGGEQLLLLHIDREPLAIISYRIPPSTPHSPPLVQAILSPTLFLDQARELARAA